MGFRLFSRGVWRVGECGLQDLHVGQQRGSVRLISLLLYSQGAGVEDDCLLLQLYLNGLLYLLLMLLSNL